jgi:spermidine synthase
VTARAAILAACFVLSGVAGLLYQVLWLRTLSLAFGHTAHAVTVVLAAVMAGLALGSFVFARWSRRLRDPVAAYGWIEIGVGVACAAVPAGLAAASALYLRLHAALDGAAGSLDVVQFVLVFLVLVVPTTLMGGTLPVLAETVGRHDGLARRVGLLYAANTFGAVMGTALAGYALLPVLGTRRTTAIAVAVNLVVGALAVALARWWPAPPAPAAPPAPRRARQRRRARHGATLAALAVSGAVAMLYEVAWTRALGLVLGSSTYAFTAMLLAFLVGIALGSALWAWRRGRPGVSPAELGVLQIATGAAAAVTLALFDRLPALFLLGFARSDSPAFVELLELAVAAAALVPSTVLIGATFPCALAIVAHTGHAGADTGRVYGVNTLGAIAGAALTGFVLIPALGLHATLKVGVVVGVTTGAALLVRSSVRWRWTAVAAAALLVAGAVSIPLWDLRVMAAGTSIYARYYVGGGGLGHSVPDETVVFYRDGPTGTVAVVDRHGTRTLRVNGKTDASDGADVQTQVLLAHVPMLVHRDPRRVMVLGLGGGVTVGSAAAHPVERVDVVELEPAVVEAARFFRAASRDALAQPVVRVVVADGRNFLLATAERYDVIVSEPSNPWIAGVAALFSLEFFETARARLRPGGVMGQWLQGYSLAADDFAMIVRTFGAAFPWTTVWYLGGHDFLLLGSERPLPLDAARIAARLEQPAVRDDLARVGVRRWPEVLGFLALGPADAARLAAGARVNDDDRLPLEFSAPRALHLGAAADVVGFVLRHRRAGPAEVVAGGVDALDRPGVHQDVAATLFRVGRFRDALDEYQEALRIEPESRVTRLSTAAAAINAGAPDVARAQALRVLARAPDDAEGHYYLGIALSQLGARDAALAALTRAAELSPSDARFRPALETLRGQAR